ncbi:MAG: acyl carrier protein [Burkholderiales bacterium]|nr:acyl carrier protein [Burkholderiales bacterium]
MLRQIIKDFVIQQFNVDPTVFDQPDLKVSDLGLDSLGVVEMLFEVEDLYGFQVDDPARYGSMSFDEMVADMETTIRAANNGQIPAPTSLQGKA